MKRPLVRLTVGLIALNAAIAVFVLLSGDIGDTEGKILATSLLATGTAVVAMVCAPALAAGRLWRIPYLGVAGAIAGFALATVSLWAEIDTIWIGKATGSAFVIAGFAALACILSAWPIAGRAAWVGAAAYALVAAVGVMVLAGMWLEIDSSGFWRAFAVAAVLLAAASLATPVLHRSSAPSRSEPIIHCPFCGSPLRGTTDTPITCPSCGRRFRVHQD